MMGDTLVTGAAGFIGSWLARRLLDQGHAVLTIDNLSSGDIDNIPERCERIIGDVSDPAVIARLDGRTFDAIYHIAGQSGGIPSFDDPVSDLNSNVASTLLLLDYAYRAKCPVFVYASSMSVYGDQELMPVVETAPTVPKSFYAVGKLASEQYMRLYAERGLACTVLRFNNTYGPGQSLANLRQGMVSIFLGQALSSRRIHVKGSPDRFRDFVHISDAVESLVLAGAPTHGARFTVYNVATTHKTTVRELVETIRGNLPFPVEVCYEGSTPGDQFGIYCSYKRIHADLGWSPTVSLTEGIANTVAWALATQMSGRLR
ncbi:NAD-dependent epimerase [Amycolatopsis thailandensis]|uniref:NAD-dependent epimerase n=2 Tax=Amycolatopsis thailandensis TaxID=589330 RepID=A0A229SBX3_9PSEU|nr:NAD-dependent epimerase [Amycolatopsis thailandensis]